jgi:Na+-driven multidrug efflux pump
MKYFLPLLYILLPLVAYAQGESRWDDIMDNVYKLLRNITTILVAVALLVFFWGIVRFISSPSALVKEEARKYMIWGIVALFVMTSVWGLTSILTNFFGFNNVIPQLNTGSN